MGLVLSDLVAETTTTSGTNDLELDGPAQDSQSFAEGIGDGQQTYYVLRGQGVWETGLGTLTAGAPDKLSRDVILTSSNGGNKVDLPLGQKQIYASIPSPRVLATTAAAAAGEFLRKASSEDGWDPITAAELAQDLAGVGQFLEAAGDVLEGDLDAQGLYTMANLADPANAGDAVPRGWAEARYLNTGGDSLGGDLDAVGTYLLKNLPAPGSQGDAASKDYVDGRVNGLSWQADVLAEQNDPPGSPAGGDRYLVGPSPTGDWSGNAQAIAEYDAGAAAWDFFAPSDGWAVNVTGSNLAGRTDVAMTFNGSDWVNFGSAVHHEAVQGLQGGATDEHYHLTNAQHSALTNSGDTTKVDGLNADQLDGHEAGDFALASETATVPVGTVVPYAGSSAPGGWLLCYGQEVSRDTYADLFNVIGETWGAGDGSTTFNLPDLRGRVAAGPDDMGGTAAGRLSDGGHGSSGGAESKSSDGHTLSNSEMPSHNHGYYRSDNQVNYVGGSSEAIYHDTWNSTGSAGGDSAHSHGINTAQPYAAINQIIKV